MLTHKGEGGTERIQEKKQLRERGLDSIGGINK
jgi:hypothetical protein